MQEELLTARPKGMDYETYCHKRRDQKLMLRNRKRFGFVVWDAKNGPLVGRVPMLIFAK